jgi:hypothetical protein
MYYKIVEISIRLKFNIGGRKWINLRIRTLRSTYNYQSQETKETKHLSS